MRPTLRNRLPSGRKASFASVSLLASVTVTAQRHEESAQDIRLAVTAQGGEDLQEKGVTNVNQLQCS